MTITRGALTRKARLALCASLAAGSSAFAASVQSADASTVPVTLELKTAVISAGQDAHALTPVIVAEKRIIADGVQLVPHSVQLAAPVNRLDSHELKLASAITHEASIVRTHGNVSSPANQKVIETAAADTRHLIGHLARDQAAVKPATSALASAFDLGSSFNSPLGGILTTLGGGVLALIGIMHALPLL
jgi:hypothetical protein